MADFSLPSHVLGAFGDSVGHAQEQPAAGPTAFVCVQETFFLGMEGPEGHTADPSTLHFSVEGQCGTWGLSWGCCALANSLSPHLPPFS